MKKSNLTVADLKRGQVMLVRVRKVHNKRTDATKDGLDYKCQIELAEFIDNEFRPMTPVGYFNQGDSRFVGNDPRRGFATLEPRMWEKDFGTLASLKEIEGLEFSSTSVGDVKSSEDWKEGVHFISLGVINPAVTIDGVNHKLHVRIVESTIQVNEAQPAKLNPSTNEVQTKDGASIYTLGTVTFGRQKSIFLLSDQMKKAISSGTLQVPDAVLTEAVRYNEMLKELSEIEVGVPSGQPAKVPAATGAPVDLRD